MDTKVISAADALPIGTHATNARIDIRKILHEVFIARRSRTCRNSARSGCWPMRPQLQSAERRLDELHKYMLRQVTASEPSSVITA